MKEVIILGSGAAARYLKYNLSYQKDVQVKGFISEDHSLFGKEIYGYPVLGKDEVLESEFRKGCRYIGIGIGNPLIRRKLREKVQSIGYELITAIHPSCIISPDVKIGSGVVIEAGAVLSDNPEIKDNVWLGLAPWVSHDTIIDMDSSVGGGANIGAEVSIGRCSMIGMGSIIKSQTKVGSNVIIGSGSNVVHDIPDNVVAVGNPARVIKQRPINF